MNACGKAALLVAVAALLCGQWREYDQVLDKEGEFYFVRMEYKDRPGLRRPWGRGWWMQDMPEAEQHFAQGIRRLTRVHTGEPRHFGFTDDRIFDYPWVYATQVGYWDLSEEETLRMRKYFERGGFLVVDDFYGEQDWAAFAQSMARVLPGQPITEMEESPELLRIVYEIKERTFIPGLRHLRRGLGGEISIQQQGGPPTWRVICDVKGHVVVAIHFNQDVGDAWEHADMPEYPEAMTALAYRFGINYILYSMTH
jgi:hypothetical protein